MNITTRDRYPDWLVRLGRKVLSLLGWRTVGVRPDVKQCVIVCAPHTSNWDLFFFLLGTVCYQIPAMFTMKKFWFFWPLNIFWGLLGGVPIDRSKSNNRVDQIVDLFEQYDVLRLGIPPEGTRKKVTYWKTGFYWVARNAGVPILLSHLDYKNREMKLATLIYPSEDVVADLTRICTYYQQHLNLTPRFQMLEKHAESDTAV